MHRKIGKAPGEKLSNKSEGHGQDTCCSSKPFLFPTKHSSPLRSNNLTKCWKNALILITFQDGETDGKGERKPTHRPCSTHSRVCKGCSLGLEHTHLHILLLLIPAPPLEPSPDTSPAQGRLLC